MKISVIIPIYNGEHYIPACLSCLQKQTYLDWEAVCVNDGSTDNSERILLGYKHLDPRIRLISQVNQGVARARESGVSEASGDYITFLDIDDTLKENALEILEREVQEYPGIGIIVAGLNIISDGKSRKGRAVGFKKLDSLSFLKRVLHGENSWELCGKMYRKDLFIPEVKVPENIRIGEDIAVFVQLISRVDMIIGCEYSIYNYIQHSTSVSHIQSVKLAEETLEAACFIEKYLKQQKKYENLKNDIGSMFLLFYSNSTRRAILGRSHPLIRYIRKHHWHLKAFIHLPWLKAMYVLMNYYLGVSIRLLK